MKRTNTCTRKIVDGAGRPAALLLLAGALGVLLATRVLAGPQAFALPWFSFPGGATTAQQGRYTLNVSAGQSATGGATGGRYGLFVGATAPEKTNDLPAGQPLYLPWIRR